MSVTFAALDFETADPHRDSACALAVVRVHDRRRADRGVKLIRPPRKHFYFTHIHGITWRDVANEPPFPAAWQQLQPLIEGARFLAAHNASFDRSVLEACCDHAGLPAPSIPYVCTVKLARRVWDIRPTKLPDVCRFLDIPLQHHDAASDAEACAEIVIRAMDAIEEMSETERKRVGTMAELLL